MRLIYLKKFSPVKKMIKLKIFCVWNHYYTNVGEKIGLDRIGSISNESLHIYFDELTDIYQCRVLAMNFPEISVMSINQCLLKLTLHICKWSLMSTYLYWNDHCIHTGLSNIDLCLTTHYSPQMRVKMTPT
jgi:hypothetical protein